MLGAASSGLALAGHMSGGGHVEPVSAALLVAGVSLGTYGWLQRERGIAAILAAVIAVQAGGHLLFSVGHAHAADSRMVLGHLVASVVLAAFLRWGEARVFAAARRRYLQWAVAVRCAMAGLPGAPVWRPVPVPALADPPAGRRGSRPPGRGPPR